MGLASLPSTALLDGLVSSLHDILLLSWTCKPVKLWRAYRVFPQPARRSLNTMRNFPHREDRQMISIARIQRTNESSPSPLWFVRPLLHCAHSQGWVTVIPD